MAVDGSGTVAGYALWNHADGYDPAVSTLRVVDLIALTGPACRALWRMLGGFGSTTATVRVRTSGDDVTRFGLPAAAWKPVQQRPYQLRLLDVPGAFDGRGVGPLDVTLPFTVTGAGLDGSYRLVAKEGLARCERVPDAAGPTFTAAGIALAYAGVQPCANLRFAGLLAGPGDDDARWDALLGGRRFHIRDYF